MFSRRPRLAIAGIARGTARDVLIRSCSRLRARRWARVVARADGRGLRRLTPWDTRGQISGPVYSPDGRTILFRLKPAGQDFGGDYWTVRSDGSSRRRLTHFGPSHTTASATWSPDGSMIVFADSGMGGNDDLYVMRADGADIRRLTRTPQWESAAIWLRP